MSEVKSVCDSLGARYERFAAVVDRATPITKLREKIVRLARGRTSEAGDETESTRSSAIM